MSQLHKRYRNGKEEYVAFEKLTEQEFRDTLVKAIYKEDDAYTETKSLEAQIHSLTTGFATLLSHLRENGTINQTTIEEILYRTQNARFY